MPLKRSFQPCAFVAALAALSASGCYIVAMPPMAPPAEGPPSAGTVRQRPLGLGASAGLFTTLDSEALNGLSEGVMWDVQASVWLSEIVAIQADYGAANLDDQYSPLGGDMTISPATVSVVFSVPDPWMPSEAFRFRFGVGGGIAKLDHSAYEVDDIAIFRMLFGAEWLLQEGGRIFAVADIMLGEEVDDASMSWWWDLRSMSSFRVGLEFAF